MASTLDFTPEQFEEALNATTEKVLQLFEKQGDQPCYANPVPADVQQGFDEPLPMSGSPYAEVLQEIEEKVLQTATFNMGPHMYAYVMAGGTQVSILAELLANTINQNVAKWHLAPAMHEIERRVVQWAAEIMGYTSDAGGVLVSGGSAANLTALTVARNQFLASEDVRKKGLFNMSKPLVVYASNEVHGCVDKSVELLGIGSDYLRKIQTHEDFTVDTEAMDKQITADLQNGLQPFCIIGNAGTVNTGHIDDLDALAALSKKYGCWFHVDGAYGGLAASIDELKPAYKGLEKADSIAVDFHKWLYQSFEAGCVLVRSWDHLHGSYHKPVSYLDSTEESDGRWNMNEHYFQLSRNAKAFKVWASLKVYGFDAIRNMIQKDIDLTHYLNDIMQAADDFKVTAIGPLGIICFQYVQPGANPEAFNQELALALEKDGRIFIAGTRLNGQYALRACLNNHRKTKETTDFMVQVIREVAKEITIENREIEN